MSDTYHQGTSTLDAMQIGCGINFEAPVNVLMKPELIGQNPIIEIAPDITHNSHNNRTDNLAKLLVAFASGTSWAEMSEARRQIRSIYSISEYQSLAREFASNSYTLHRMLDLVLEEEFEFDWQDSESENYIQLCRSIALRSSVQEIKERALYECLNAIGRYQTRLHARRPYLVKQRTIEKVKLQVLLELSAPESSCRVMVINKLIEYAKFGPGHLSKANARVGLRTIAVRDGANYLMEDLIAGPLEVQYQTVTLLSYYKARRAVAPLLQGLLEIKDERITSLIRSTLTGQYAHEYKLVIRELSRKDERFSTLEV